jgi:hypothetical protein
MDKTELLRAMRAGHAPIAAAIAGMSDDELLAEAPGMPGWTRKDVLAHVEWWHRHSSAVLEGVRSGVNPHPDTDEAWDIDAHNARVLAENRGRSAADVRTGEAASFDELVAAVEAATDHELFDVGIQPWLEDAAADVVAGDSSGHYPEHVPHLAAG